MHRRKTTLKCTICVFFTCVESCTESRVMKNTPRKHHFVPQFYLKQFAIPGTDEGTLFVFDLRQGKSMPRESNPRCSGFSRNLYTIKQDVTGDSMFVEKELGKLEAKWSQVLQALIRSRSMPDDEAFGDLMLFVAFLAVRVPRIRNCISKFIDQVSKSILQLTLATVHGRGEFRKDLEMQGRFLTDKQFEGLILFAQSDSYEVDYEKTWHVQGMIEMAITLAPLLSVRKWSLLVADEGAPDFVCSDSPVSLDWIKRGECMHSPGFATRNTILTVPLCRRLALASTFEIDMSQVCLGREGVASINGMTIRHASQVYSPVPDFAWTFDGNVKSSTQLLGNLAR